MTASRKPPRSFMVHAHRRLTMSELEDVRAYARLATEMMLKQAKEHEAYVDAAVSNLSEEEAEAYFENNLDTYELLVRRFPNQQQHSLVVLAYSAVETRLISVARTLLRVSGSGLNLKDLAGESPFQKARKVISKVADIPIEQKLWDAVEAYRLVRNGIVHNAGEFLPEPPQLVQRLLSDRPSEIQNDQNEGLTLQPAFVFGFLDSSELLFEAIFDGWLKKEQGGAA